MNKKYLALTVLSLMLMGIFSSLTAFAASDIAMTETIDLKSFYNLDFFAKATDSSEDLEANLNETNLTNTKTEQWLNGRILEEALTDGVLTVDGINYKFGSVSGRDKNAVLMTEDVTIPVGDAYLGSLSVAVANRCAEPDSLNYILNYSDGTTSEPTSFSFAYWGNNDAINPSTVLIDCKRYVYRYRTVNEKNTLQSFEYNDESGNIYAVSLPVTAQKKVASVTFKKSSRAAEFAPVIFALTKVYETPSAMASYINTNSDCYKTITDDNKAEALEFSSYVKFALAHGLTASNINDYDTVSTIEKRIRATNRKTSPVDLSNYFTNDYFAKSTDSVEDLQANLDATKTDSSSNGQEQWYNAQALEDAMTNGVLTVDGIDYKFGNLSGRNYNGLLLTADTTIPLSGDELDSIYITAAEINWANKSLSYVINYSDGTTGGTQTQTVGIWMQSDDATKDDILIDTKRYVYRNRANGAYMNEPYNDVCLIYAYKLPIEDGKKAASVTFKKSPSDNIAIFGVTEVYETVGELSAKIDSRLESYNAANIESYTAAELSELFAYIDFAKAKGGVNDKDFNSEKATALKSAYMDLQEEFATVDLSDYFEYDVFMKEDDEKKSAISFEGNNTLGAVENGVVPTAKTLWFESEAVLKAQDESGYVSYNGLKYKFGDLTEYNKNAFGLYKDLSDGTQRFTQNIELSGSYTDRISILAGRRIGSNSNAGNLNYEVVYADGSSTKGKLYINESGTLVENKTPVVTGYMIRYAWNDTYPGYWKVNSKGWEVYTYIYDYDIPADPSKKAVSVKLTETWWQPDIFVFAMTEVYPSAKTIKEGLKNIPTSIAEMTFDNIDYVKNIDGWKELADKKNIEMPISDETIASLKARASLIKNGLLIENGAKKLENGTLSFNSDVYNFSEWDLDVYVIIAEYDSDFDTLVNVNYVKNTVSKNNDKQTLSATLENVTDENNVQVMLWGGNYTPFANVQ